jgi:hypothetical protein
MEIGRTFAIFRGFWKSPNEYILAIVEVDGEATKVVYLKKPFKERPDFAATSVNYDIEKLFEESDVIYRSERK